MFVFARQFDIVVMKNSKPAADAPANTHKLPFPLDKHNAKVLAHAKVSAHFLFVLLNSFADKQETHQI